MIERLEGTFFGYEDCELFYQLWRPETSRGTIVVTHGISEHSECYNRFANTMAQDNWTIVGWDLRGHGRSEGKRGYVADFSEFSNDLDALIKFVKAQILKRDQPLVLFGHSLGGLITLRTMVNNAPANIAALALSSPALGLSLPVPKIKERAAEILATWLPKVTLYNEIRYADLIRDTEMQKEYRNDPLRHDKASPQVYLGMQTAIQELNKQAAEIYVPVIMQLAGKEKIVSTPASEKFFELIGSKKKEIFVYADSLHEIFQDLGRDEVFADLKQFLNRVREDKK
jgi:alpha-beta hydrolase superfamily lysophospholipase